MLKNNIQRIPSTDSVGVSPPSSPVGNRTKEAPSEPLDDKNPRYQLPIGLPLQNPGEGRVLYITRHVESQYNMENRIGGNPCLSPNGQKYAKALGNYINQNLEIDEVSCLLPTTSMEPFYCTSSVLNLLLRLVSSFGNWFQWLVTSDFLVCLRQSCGLIYIDLYGIL